MKYGELKKLVALELQIEQKVKQYHQISIIKSWIHLLLLFTTMKSYLYQVSISTYKLTITSISLK